MSDKYGSHADYMKWVKEDADSRQEAMEDALRKAFSNFIEKREVEVVVFSNMSAFYLGKAITNHPLILKPLLAACNIAARAIERDLSIKNLDTYSPRLNEDQAKVIAGYIKPFLPSYLEIPALSQIDRVAFIDKEIRKRKGRWEKKVIEALNRFGRLRFHKRMFVAEGEQFELDAASPKSGDIKVGVDIKRIEARRDIHKRCDEIVNKAAKLKSAFPGCKFGAVVYYPFIEEHINIQNRLHSDNIDVIVFASEAKESIENAVRMLLSTLGGQKNDCSKNCTSFDSG
jgi:hypothetical protein